MKPQYADIEYRTGTVVEGLRIGLDAKLQYERTARAKRWNQEEQPFTTTAYLAWAAARTAGHPGTPDSWEQFLAEVTDVFMYTNDDIADQTVRDDDLPDPTRQAATTG